MALSNSFEMLGAMSNPKMIKTSCGIEKYQKLKSNKTMIGKIRFYWFYFFAIIRDSYK